MKTKAIFLLVIFLLNTVVGFACAVGMERDTHGESHGHNSSKITNDKHRHQHKGAHLHKHSSLKGTNLSKEDPCCKTLVNDLVVQGKLVPQSVKNQVILPVLLLPDNNYNFLLPSVKLALKKSVYTGQRERPPNRDIRITINSFQI
ncbi:hypothetical protein [Pedobacter suwonensis]|uniref:hypothetical protein n=1 Tax=Pedobacter suwonensis TaxID=332999 RepID=UPI0011A9A7C7|nr:hypothetical protein [Pedobacter suwonensis]